MSHQLARVIREKGFDPSTAGEAMNAANWVLQALDPSDETIGPVVGIPDHNDQPSTVLNFRQIDAINPNTALTLGANDTWDMDIMFFEGPYVLAAYQQRKSADPTKYYNGWIVNNQYNFGTTGPQILNDGNGTQGNVSIYGPGVQTNWQQNVSFHRATHASFTGHCNAASLTDQGMLVATQIPTQWWERQYNDGFSLGLAAISVTGGSTAPVQVPVSMSRETPVIELTFGNGTAAGPTGLIQSAQVPTFNTALQTSPKSGSWRAKEGFYIPLRYQKPVMEFKDTVNRGLASFVHPWAHTSAPSNLPPNPFPTYSSGLSELGPVFVQPWANLMRTGAVCIQGVQPTTTWSIHSRYGYEMLTPVGSILGATLTPSCMPSDVMMETYFKLRHVLDDAYPAAYNDKELLAKIIQFMAPMLIDMLPKNLQGAANSLTKFGVGMLKGPSSSKGGNKATTRMLLGPTDDDEEPAPTSKKAGRKIQPVRNVGKTAANMLLPGKRKRGK